MIPDAKLVKLITLSDALDSLGLREESDRIDDIIAQEYRDRRFRFVSPVRFVDVEEEQ